MPSGEGRIEDHRAIKFIKGVAKLPETKAKGQDKKQRHGDSAIAGAMAWFAVHAEWGGPVEYQSAAKRIIASDGADEYESRAGAWRRGAY